MISKPAGQRERVLSRLHALDDAQKKRLHTLLLLLATAILAVVLHSAVPWLLTAWVTVASLSATARTGLSVTAAVGAAAVLRAARRRGHIAR